MSVTRGQAVVDDIEVVPMRRRHVRAVSRIESEVYPRPWSPSLFMGELALERDRVYFVARRNTSVVGYAGAMLTGFEGHITTLVVHPDHRRQGIGSRLLLEVVTEVRQRGAPSLTLEVRVSNRAAQGLYRRFGFCPAGVRRGYYVDTKEDALIMWATDVDEADYGQRLVRIRAELGGHLPPAPANGPASGVQR